MSVGEEVVFKLQKAMKHPQEFDDALFSLDNTNEIVSHCVQEFMKKDLVKEHVDQVNEKVENTPICSN